jgi:hypothetical protein
MTSGCKKWENVQRLLSINNTSTRSVTYEHKSTHIGNSIPIDGTIARFTCAPYYEKNSVEQRPFVCLDGTRSEPAPKCIALSGQRARENTDKIIGGNSTRQGLFSWHVAIYLNDVIICGGSLLSERVILTAAQCVTHSDGQLHPKENYTIAVGKYFSKIWNNIAVFKSFFVFHQFTHHCCCLLYR